MQGLNLTGFTSNWEDKTLKNLQYASGNGRPVHMYCELIKSRKKKNRLSN